MKKFLGAISLSLISFYSFGDVKVEGQWARAAAQTSKNSAAYMKLSLADGDQPCALTAASSNICDKVELHNHSVDEKGVARMFKVENIAIEPGKTTELKPRNYHIMLMGLKKNLDENDKIPLTLTFSDGKTQTIDVPVKKGHCCGCKKS
jgi:periplasmic copper chaperone A